MHTFLMKTKWLKDVEEVDARDLGFLENLKALYSTFVTILSQGRALKCEGMLTHALGHKVKETARALVRKELIDISTSHVSEEMVQPALMKAAKALID
jgi:hypothetical protein